MDSDLQWIVIQLLLCSCCTVVVKVDLTRVLWVYPIIQKEEEVSAFYTLFDELRDDANKFFFLNYFQMSISSFDELHRRLKDSLLRRNSKMRNCSQPVEMLAVAIR
jgi:hypothetical protein